MSYFPIPLRAFTAEMGLSPPFTAWYSNDRATGSNLSPDHIQNWAMRSVPDVIAGVNSRDQITTTSAANLGRGWAVQPSYFTLNQSDPRVQDWNLTIEKGIMSNTVARVSYVGNHGSALEQFYSYNQQMPNYIWYVTTRQQLPSGAYSGVLTRPFDKVTDEEGTDLWAVHNGWASLTPVHLDLTAHHFIADLAAWDITI